jgi:hypothetical protein
LGRRRGSAVRCDHDNIRHFRQRRKRLISIPGKNQGSKISDGSEGSAFNSAGFIRARKGFSLTTLRVNAQRDVRFLDGLVLGYRDLRIGGLVQPFLDYICETCVECRHG